MRGRKEVWIGFGILVILVLIIIGIKFFSTNGESIMESNLKTETAVCPKCQMDCVLSSEFPVNDPQFLEEMGLLDDAIRVADKMLNSKVK